MDDERGEELAEPSDAGQWSDTPMVTYWSRPPAGQANDQPIDPAVPGSATPPTPPSQPLATMPSWTLPPAPAVRKGRLRRTPSWVVVAIVAAVVGGGAGAAVTQAFSTSSGGPVVSASQGAPGPALAGGASIPSIVKMLLPEVVSIDAKGPGSSGLGGTGPTEDQGTGMIISTDGEVLTNNHVISGATTITATLYGQTQALPALLVGADPSNDAALLKIESPPAGLKAVTFGDSRQLQVGDAVIAIGNALGLSAGTPTVTSGIVSALGRTVQAGDASGGSTENLTNLIQTDAAINSGNSGGPLVDSSGDVVAMDTAVAASSANNAPAENIGFAIPSATIEGLLSNLRSGGTAGNSKAYLGVEVEDETAQLQQAYGFVPASGAVVVTVIDGSPAATAGIEQGDVIVSFDGKAVNTAQDLTNDVQAQSTGHVARIGLYRGQQKITVSVTLGSAPAG